MAPEPKTKPHGGGLGGLTRNRKALIAAAVALVVVFVYLRSRSSSSTPATSVGVDPNAIDPATGETYAQEQQAALAAQASGSSVGSVGTTADQITTASGESLSGALSDLSSGLAGLQTQQANDESLIQSAAQAAAQAQQTADSITSLGSPGPQGAGVGAGTPAIGTVTGGTVDVESTTNNITGGTVYQAPVTVNAPPPVTPAPAAAPTKSTATTTKTTSSPPKATTATVAPVELTARAGATKGQRPG